MGAKIKFDEDARELFLGGLREGLTRGAAASAAGVNSGTVRRHMVKDEKLQELATQAELEAIGVVESALYQKAKKGSVRALMFFLCNRHPQQWRNLNRIEHKIEATVRQVFVDERARIAAMSQDEQAALFQESFAMGTKG